MKAIYGYKDGSGDFFLTVDTDRCTACGACVPACPAGVFRMAVNDYDEQVAEVTEAHRRSLKYSCAPCKPSGQRPPLPCVTACEAAAIVHSW